MESPFSKEAGHPEIAPAWRLLAMLLVLAAGAVLVLTLTGYLRFQLGKEEKKDGVAARQGDDKKEEDDKKPAPRRAYIALDKNAEETLKLFFSDVRVFRGKGALLDFWIEVDEDGKKRELVAHKASIGKDEPTDDMKALAVLVQKDDALSVVFSAGGVGQSTRHIPLPPIKPLSDKNLVTRPQETNTDISFERSKVGDEFTLFKTSQNEMVMKEMEKGVFASEKELSRRTLTLKCRIAALKLSAPKE